MYRFGLPNIGLACKLCAIIHVYPQTKIRSEEGTSFGISIKHGFKIQFQVLEKFYFIRTSEEKACLRKGNPKPYFSVSLSEC